MRIVIAPDSFKGTATAVDVAAAIAAGWRTVRSDDELLQLPMADGGEGTIDALERGIAHAVRVPSTVSGPLSDPIAADWLRFVDADGVDTGVVELAQTSGLPLLDPLDPLHAHTLGFGQQIALALDAGVQRLLLAVGGSSSTDGGTGALTALGAKFLDEAAHRLPLGGGALERLSSVSFGAVREVPSEGAYLLSDVRNPLTGPLGAAAVFGPQKGASLDQVLLLERGLARLARRMPVDPTATGAGAAGGTGFGMLAWGAIARSGAEAVCEAIGVGAALPGADLVITGEGSYDQQTSSGKVASEIELVATRHHVPVAVVAGRISVASETVDSAVSLEELAGGTEAAMRDTISWLEAAGAELARRYSR
nr:glycerate kinase [Naasia lichenicola]